MEDNAGPALDQGPGRRPGRQELGAHRVGDRLEKVLDRYLRQRFLDVSVADDVERDIDGSDLFGDRIHIGIDLRSSKASRGGMASPPVERIWSATMSSFDLVRPARKARAPSRAKARATAAPMCPPAP
jgi:hypothetical protein